VQHNFTILLHIILRRHRNIRISKKFACSVMCEEGVDYYIYPRGYRNKKSQNVKDVKLKYILVIFG